MNMIHLVKSCCAVLTLTLAGSALADCVHSVTIPSSGLANAACSGGGDSGRGAAFSNASGGQVRAEMLTGTDDFARSHLLNQQGLTICVVEDITPGNGPVTGPSSPTCANGKFLQLIVR